VVRGGLARLALGAALALTGVAAVAGPMANVVPEPLSVSAPAQAEPVSIRDGATIVAADPQAAKVARYLADLTLRTRGLRLAVAAAPPAAGPAIVLTRASRLSGEAYELEVGDGRAAISAGTDAGLFYGAGTLWQLMTPDGRRGPVTLPPVHIADQPRFAWRGLMLDSARHFQPPAEIEKILDAMALHKLNVLHWRLTDDQGWRLQIRKYPRLTEVGAWRTPPEGSPDGTGRYGGFYTQDEVRRIVAYAAARHITVVPEIEMPGHATSALLAYPQFGAGAAAQGKWGVSPYVYSADDRAVGFLEDVLTEVMALFPGRYVHVGGDEVQHERWNASPAAQARLRALGGQDAAALQVDLTHRIADFLQAHGRRLVGWDEILQGGSLPGEAVVMSWHGVDGATAAAAAGHDAVLAPAPMMYFDNWQAADPAGPPGRGFLVTLHDVYGFEPAPASLSADAARHILGLQGALWTEHIRTSAELEAMAFPRAAAVAEDAWSAPERKDWNSFVARLPAQAARYAALGVGASPAVLSVRIAAAPAAGGATVTLARQAGPGEVRYTADGSEPTGASPRYDAPFAVALPSQVRAALFLDGVRAGPVAARRIDAAATRRRASQDLTLCNPGLALNLEGPADAAGPHAYLTNPQDACWIYPAADLTGVEALTATFARLPFNFSLDAGHNTVTLHPPRQPAGELEVREDGCQTDPVAVAAVPPGAPGQRGAVRLALPPRAGLHDLCFSFTAQAIDPMLALDVVQLEPAR